MNGIDVYDAHCLKLLLDYKPEAGDIFACWGADFASRFISGVTSRVIAPKSLRWSPSHVAIAAPDFDHTPGVQLWYESTTMCRHACLYARERVSGVQVHPILPRLKDYLLSGGKVRVFRLVHPIDTVYSSDAVVANIQAGYLVVMLREYLAAGTKYDLRGALFSGLTITPRLLSLLGVSREHLFCSDMVASLLMRLNRMPLSDPGLMTPGGLLRYLVTHAIYRELLL